MDDVWFSERHQKGVWTARTVWNGCTFTIASMSLPPFVMLVTSAFIESSIFIESSMTHLLFFRLTSELCTPMSAGPILKLPRRLMNESATRTIFAMGSAAVFVAERRLEQQELSLYPRCAVGAGLPEANAGEQNVI
jgi:hypothetical protein